MKRPYQQLIVWQEAHRLCIDVYRVTKSFPSDERFRLVDQLCRAASSVPTNIAEGSARRSHAEQARFYDIAKASLEEVHYHLFLAKDLDYINSEIFALFDDCISRTSYLLVKLRMKAKFLTSQTSPTS